MKKFKKLALLPAACAVSLFVPTMALAADTENVLANALNQPVSARSVGMLCLGAVIALLAVLLVKRFRAKKN